MRALPDALTSWQMAASTEDLAGAVASFPLSGLPLEAADAMIENCIG
jgi:hypothetical protein